MLEPDNHGGGGGNRRQKCSMQIVGWYTMQGSGTVSQGFNCWYRIRALEYCCCRKVGGDDNLVFSLYTLFLLPHNYDVTGIQKDCHTYVLLAKVSQ